MFLIINSRDPLHRLLSLSAALEAEIVCASVGREKHQHIVTAWPKDHYIICFENNSRLTLLKDTEKIDYTRKGNIPIN